jgi:transcription elongation factor Elf1
MVKIDFECPLCNEKNNLILMGDKSGEFNKKCKACEAQLEVSNKSKKIEVKARFPKNKTEGNIFSSQNISDSVINKSNVTMTHHHYSEINEPQKKAEREVKKANDNKIPSDYKKHEIENSKHKMVKIIAIMILCSSIMGFMTGWGLLNYFESDFNGYREIEIEIVVKNNTADLDNAIIILDKKEMNHTYLGNGTYHILSKPGKHSVKVIAPAHKNTTMEIFIPPQDDNLSLVDIEQGIDGVNRFTFEMEEGTGKNDLEDTTYLKIGGWCPNLIFIFSLIGLWGAWVTYTLQSYNNAQIGAFFSVLAMGFLIIGPILGIVALFYLKKYKFLFTASFKN